MSPPGLRPATADQLLARLGREQRERRLPSVVAGVVRDGVLTWSGGRGRVGDAEPTADTQYRIGSITKPLVAVAVLRLRDEGRLSLADRVADHLPDAPVARATVAQLLSHTSGLQAETNGPWWERTPGGTWSQLLEDLGAGGVRHRPGRRFHYSNVGYAVLGELVGRLRGRPWDEVVHDEVLTPLGMHRTTTRPVAPAAEGLAVHPWADVVLPEPEHDAGVMGPAGQLWSTVTDLARFAAFLAGTGGEQVLSTATREEMREPLALDDRPDQAWTTAHGLGVQVHNVDGRRAVGHGGSMPGFLAVLRVDVDTGDGAVVAANATAGLTGPVAADLLDLLQAAEPPARPAWAPGTVDDEVLELTGVWYWGPTPLQLWAGRDVALELAPLTGSGRASRFRARAEGTYEGLDAYYAGETLRVVRRADGTVSHLDLASFVLTRRPYDPDAGVPGGVAPEGWGVPGRDR